PLDRRLRISFSAPATHLSHPYILSLHDALPILIVPAIYAMAAASWPNGGRTTFNAIYLAQNLGVSIGAAAGGFVADFSFKYIFMANLLLYVVFIIIALRY